MLTLKLSFFKLDLFLKSHTDALRRLQCISGLAVKTKAYTMLQFSSKLIFFPYLTEPSAIIGYLNLPFLLSE